MECLDRVFFFIYLRINFFVIDDIILFGNGKKIFRRIASGVFEDLKIKRLHGTDTIRF